MTTDDGGQPTSPRDAKDSQEASTPDIRTLTTALLAAADKTNRTRKDQP